TYDGSTVATSVLLKDGSGNIGHWPLCRVEDMDGNFMTYHYTVREQEDADGNKLGKQLWPDSIVYTGYRNGNTEERGKYRVVFSSGFHPRFRLMQALELNQSDPDGQTNGTDSTYQDLGDGCDIKIRVRKRDRRTGTLLSGAVFNLHNNTNDMCLTTNSIGEAVWMLKTPDDYELFLREETPPSGWCTRMQDISLHVVKVSGACHLDVSALDVHVDSVIYENTLGTEVRIVVTNDICGDEAYQCVDVCDCDSVWDDLEGEYPYDMRTDARLGFLRSSKEKMRRMVVYYRDSVVRSYSFCYGRDIFGRAQLRSIRQYGADCSEEPFTHTFSYYRDADSVRLESGGHDVDNAGRVDNTGSGSFLSKAARVVEQAARDLVSAETAIGGSLNLSGGGGGGADIGLGLNVCSREASAGYSLGYSAGIGTGLATLADIDGDGLPDRVYLRDNQVYYKPQVAGGNAFGTERKLGASSFLSDNSATFHHGPAVNVGQAHGGLGWSSTVSRTSVYIADVNGDGLTDLVNNGRAVTIQPAHTSPVISGAGGCGLPSVTDGEDSAARISLKCVPSVEMAGGADTVSYDLVRVWRSAGNGMYKIHAPVKVLGDTLAGVIPTRDSILVSVEFYGKRFATDINRSHFLIASKWLEPGENAWTGNLLSLTGELAGGVAGLLDCDQLPISEGMLFFRVRSKGGRPVSHAVEWDPQVVLGANPAKKASECQLLEGSGRLHCPFTGVLRLRDTLDPQGMNGSVDYIMRRNNAVFRNYPYSYSSPGLGQATYYNDTLHVRRGDSLEFSVVASSGDGIVANQWRPHLYYETVTDSNTNGKLDTVSMLLLSGVAADTVLLMELFPVPGYSFPAHTVHPLFGGMYGGWGHFQYRHDERDTLDTVAVNAFADSIAAFNRNTLDRYGYMNDTDFLKRIFDSGDPIPVDTLDSIRMRFRCLPLWANGETRRHEGICPNSYIDGKRICLGNYVLPELVVKNNDSLFATQGAYAGTGTVAGSATGAAPSSPASAMVFSSLDKISESSSRSYTCGAWMFGASYSHGTSATTHDLMDLNGDGCPDFIRPGGNVYYSLPHLSIWEAAARQTLPSGGYHLSSNKTAGGNFTAQSAHTVQKSTNSGKGQNVIIERSVSNSLNAGVNTNISGDRVEHTLTDINGDGLPDMLYSDGKVALNTGYGFTPRRIWGGIEKIGVYSSVAGGADVSSGTGADGAVWQEVMDNPKNSSTVMGKGARKFTQKSAWKASISGGASFTLSLNQHQVTLADINGDGLPDLVYKGTSDNAAPGFLGTVSGGHIWYRLNTGNGFAGRWKRWTADGGNLVWGLSATAGANLNGTGGATFSWVKVSGSGNGNASITTSGDLIQISDFDGDGLPDLLRSGGGSDLEVRYAELGRTGLLKTVTTPLGGSITMDYAMTPANVHHSRRWVMTKVMTNDSLPGDGCDMQRTCVSYAYGYHDRAEREFLGFAMVTVSSLDGNGDTLGRSVRYYDNRSVHAKGSLLCEAVLGRVGQAYRTYHVTTCTYTTDSVGVRMGGTRAVFPKLTRRQTCHYDENGHPKITAWETFEYEDTYGNVTRQRQGADGSWSGKQIQPTVDANISYHAQYNDNHCVNRVSSVEIPGYKKRTTEVDNKGHYTVFRDYYDNTHSLVTRLQYDQYGNVTTMRSPNTTVHYTYDNYVHSYPTAITDTFGISSGLQNYDFRFGIPRTIVDQAGSRMEYTLDEWGRTVSIQGPKELAAQVPYTIRYNYTGREPAPSGSTHQRAVSMAMTEHYDPQHPSNPIKTYTYCDGLGRIVQTRKEAAVNGVEKLVVSGHTVIDALGRTVASYYPTETNLGDTVFAFVPDQSAPASTVTYDVLDRPLVQTAPDASTTTFQYGFDSTYNDTVLFSTITTDANNHSSTELKDAGGRPRAVQASGQPYVHFIYDHVGNNTNVRSSVADDWERNYTYDWLGRRLTY
ncbi:MAG: hypothetical protein II525_05580, partial [Bacteroidales bacterium]|nr:hypothetical protein [Bacteroidales bacterium]